MKALVIINVGKDESMKIALEMKEYLNDLSVETDFINFDGFSDNFTISNYDFAITLGGDGTVLYAARNCVENNIPIFPVNLGQFGFIATVQPEDWKKELLNFLHNPLKTKSAPNYVSSFFLFFEYELARSVSVFLVSNTLYPISIKTSANVLFFD